MDIKDWLIDWFTKHSSLDAEGIKAALTANYMEEGMIDSFSFVMLISDIDEEYGVAFTNEDFLNPDFMNIEGLTKMIDERKEA